MRNANYHVLTALNIVFGFMMLPGSSTVTAADNVGSDDVPWVIADENIEEAVEIIPDMQSPFINAVLPELRRRDKGSS